MREHLETLPFEKEIIKIAGKEIVVQGRTTCSQADFKGLSYRYSGKTQVAHAWSEPVRRMKERLEGFLGCTLNYVIINRYVNGQASIGLHSDDERDMLKDPNLDEQFVVSVSFGAVRKFILKPKKGKENHKFVYLEEGSVCVMHGQCQSLWKHAVPKVTSSDGPMAENGIRWNLTFRLMKV